MKTSFNEIFEKVKDKFSIENRVGHINDDFIMSTVTYLTKVKVPNTRYKMQSYVTATEDLENEFIEDLIDYLEKTTAKPLWRINQKRITHGLESWL